jgi:hypothetical protein
LSAGPIVISGAAIGLMDYPRIRQSRDRQTANIGVTRMMMISGINQNVADALQEVSALTGSDLWQMTK